MQQHSCDILIVGGGPAGSSLAWSMRDSGLDIMLMDKQTFPRHKTCAGWITPTVIDTLALDLETYAADHTLQPVRGFRIGQIGSDVIDIDYTRPVSYGIRRCEFDHYLLQRSGVRLLAGEALKTLQRRNNRWIINDNIDAGLVVGAGGHFCPVARHLGAKTGRAETAVAAQEIEFRMNREQQSLCNIDPEKPELYFCPDLQGYGWILIKGEYLNIGLGREDRHKLSSHVDAFCRFLRERGKYRFDLPGSFNGHAYLLYQHSSRPALQDGILLIGDAAGLAYTQSGEGIRPAIESGILAGQVIREAQGDYRKEMLSAYADAISHRFGKRKTWTRPAMPGLPAGIKQYLAKHLLKSEWFGRNVVINRWFLHTDVPALDLG
ncbi:MAG TPA: NAD(P)-binding protein [Gammaproteobacteria bacterium]|nr:NAD(P)-binding protein [Gammaproteobacteria bacterium]